LIMENVDLYPKRKTSDSTLRIISQILENFSLSMDVQLVRRYSGTSNSGCFVALRTWIVLRDDMFSSRMR
jgi:hypothetical protein